MTLHPIRPATPPPSGILILSDRTESAAWESDLETKGFLLKHFRPGQTVADIWHAHRPQLVVIDLDESIPDLVKRCASTRESFAGPLLVLLSRPDPQGIMELYQAGADECLLMPQEAVRLPVKALAWTRRYEWSGQSRLSAEKLD